MIKFLKNLLSKPPVDPQEDSAVVINDPPELNYNDLRHNFYKRTYDFKYYKKKLSSSKPRLLHWIGSVDYSGYTREKSLKYLIDNYQYGDENRILLRLEDWVPAIRKRAEKWTEEYFPQLPLEQINENYNLLLYLSRKESLKGSSVFELINKCLLKKTLETAQKDFTKLHPRFRRYLYELALPDDQRLRSWLIFEKDPFNRCILLNHYSYDELSPDEIRHLQNDKSVMVRRRLLDEQIKRGIQPAKEILIRYCKDQNIGIREYARFYLKKYYNVDAYDFYVEQDDDSFYYLADYGKKEDADVFLDGMKSQNTMVRYLCLKTLCNIDASYLRDLNAEKLLRDNRKIRKLVCANIPRIYSIDQLKNMKATILQIHEKGLLMYLQMLSRKSFWHFLDEALSVLIEDSADHNVEMVKRIYYRCSYTFEPLPDAMKDGFKEKLEILSQDSRWVIQDLIKQVLFRMK